MEKKKKNIRRSKLGDIVRFHYTVEFVDGGVHATSVGKQPLQLKLGDGSIIPGVERMLLGMAEGEIRKVTVPQNQAYGVYEQELVMVVQRKELPKGFDPKLGQALESEVSEGRKVDFKVIKVDKERITLDANHPFAGREPIFTLKMLEILR